MKKHWLYPIGFLLFVLGVTSVTMSLVGVRWAFLGFLDSFSPLLGFVAKVLMVIAGAVCVYFAGFDWESERAESMREDD